MFTCCSVILAVVIVAVVVAVIRQEQAQPPYQMVKLERAMNWDQRTWSHDYLVDIDNLIAHYRKDKNRGQA